VRPPRCLTPNIGFLTNGFFDVRHLFMSDIWGKIPRLRKGPCAVRHT
jgi:hypothetical protein